MKKVYLVILAIFWTTYISACPNVNPSFTYTNSHTCGIPAVLSITNNSTGTLASATTTMYLWKVNNKVVDTSYGLTAPSTVLLTKSGNSSIEVVSVDSSGCRDSFKSTATVNTTAPKIKDGYGGNSYTPTWLNCIQFRSDSDSFRVKLESADTLNNPMVIWGDGNAKDSTSKLLPGDSLYHYYKKTGIFTYKVVLYNSATNCTDTLYGTVINQRQPTAGITGPSSGQNRGCAPHTITFKNNSYNVTEETLITWDFGDGKTAEQNAVTDPDSISHTYMGALCNGIVTLKASNACGNSQTTWNPIDISEKDIAVIAVDTNNCDKTEPFVFQNKSSDLFCSNPDPKSYYWDFGDGDSTGWIFSKDDQEHIYDEPGEYTVMLIAKNNCGNDTTYFKFTAIFDPEPNFIVDSSAGCQPITTTVTDISKGWNVTRSWDFGDGNTSTDSIASNTYVKGGTYTLKLSATNTCSTKDTTIEINIYDKPTAKVNLRGQGCTPYSQAFFNNSTTYTDSTSYFWNFDDGTTSTLKSPSSKSYTNPRSYKVSLRVTNTCGTDSDTSNFEVFGYPKITASADSTICTFDSLLLSLASDLNSTYNIKWGDGKSSTGTNDSFYHVYEVDGLKTIIISAQGPGGCTSHDTINVSVKPGALAKFSVDKIYACSPATFNITDESKNSSNYWWYINDSLVSNNSNFSSISLSKDSTIKSVKLKTKNAGFCALDSLEIDVFTPKNPLSKFELKDSWSCGPFNIDITNNSENASIYNWKIGSINSSDFEPNIQLNASNFNDTVYSAQLIAINWANCKDSSSHNIGVYPTPTVNFTTNNDKGCGPLNATFSNISSPKDTGSINIMNFSWDFGNGSQSNATSPSNTFHSSSFQDTNYNIKLIGTSEHGCVDSIQKSILVYPKPIAKFTLDKNDGCAPLNPVITNLSSPQDTGSIAIMSFDWNINSKSIAITNPSPSFSASNTKDTIHQILLIASSEHGCKDTFSQDVKVYPNPISKFSPSNVEGCTPFSPNFINQSIPNDTGSIGIMTFNWNFNNGMTSQMSNPSTLYANNKNVDSAFKVDLEAISEHGCKDNSSQIITIHPRPKSDLIVGNNNACGPLTINFTNNSINVDSVLWSIDGNWFSGGNTMSSRFIPSQLFDTIYNIGISGKSIYGCTSDTTFKPVRVLGSPKAQFSLSKDTSCNEDPTLFYNTSLAAYKYSWNFGDGTQSGLINPTKTFKADNVNGKAISYPIKLIATNVFGCTDTANAIFTAAPLPQAKIAVNTKDGCGDLSINFVNNSKYGRTQKWSFGEGTSSTDANPSFVYTNSSPKPKQFVVTLESFAQAGCNAIDTATITVHPKPFISVQANRLNVCDSGGFDFLVSGPNISELSWDFGNGNRSNSIPNNGTPNRHFFKKSVWGDTNYITKVVAKSVKGCVDSTYKLVKLNAKLIADFDQTPDSDCVPATAAFTNKSKNATHYLWEFGDSSGSGATNPNHTYRKAGLYSVKLSAFDKNGCKSVKYGANNFLARETPVAEFVMSPGVLKLPNAKATFSNLTIYSQPTQFEWDFGDGVTSTALNPVHDYVDSGVYKVKLLAKNNTCQDVIIKQIIVDPSLPIVDFDPEGAVGCAPLRVQFNEKSQFANKFTWHFGDGHSSSEANPSHVYENDGFYTVTLLAEGPGGVSRIVKTNIIEVKITPRCHFYATPDSAFLPNARFDMVNKSINASSFSWEVNNASTDLLVATSQDKNPSFIINEKGSYNVTLMATNNNNCQDTLEKPLLLLVLNQGRIYVPTGFTPNGDNINDDFKPVMTGVNTEEYIFRVYNRWGEQIFETTDKNASWDGTVNKKDIAENVFIWTISGKFADGTYFNEKGTVTLLK